MIKTARITHSIGVGQTSLGELSLGTFSRGSQSVVPQRVSWGSSQYLVGDGVHLYATPREGFDERRLVEGGDVRALTYATLAQLLGPGEHTVSVMLGLPIEVLESENAREIRRRSKAWLEDTHRFQVDGQEYTVHIASANSTAQPAGAFFAWGLNDAGRWKRDSGDLKALVAICDVGFNTLDVFTVQSGQVIRRFTGGDTAGMRRAIEVIQTSLETQHGVQYSPQEIDQWIREGRKSLHIHSGRIPISGLIEDALNDAANGIGTFLEAQWGNGYQFAYLIFTGGGSLALRHALTALYPSGIVLKDPVLGNALGLARYARRQYEGAVIGLDPGFGAYKGVLIY